MLKSCIIISETLIFHIAFIFVNFDDFPKYLLKYCNHVQHFVQSLELRQIVISSFCTYFNTISKINTFLYSVEILVQQSVVKTFHSMCSSIFIKKKNQFHF